MLHSHHVWCLDALLRRRLRGYVLAVRQRLSACVGVASATLGGRRLTRTLIRGNPLMSAFQDVSYETLALRWGSIVQSMPIEDVLISEVQDPLLSRAKGVNKAHLQTLLEADIELPPIVVHRPSKRLVDGLHRLRAEQQRGATHVKARFFDGSHNEAFALAVHLNVVHGLPLSLHDRKNAAVTLLRSEPGWSDRLIGKLAGLSHKTIAKLRASSTGDGTHLNDDRRVGRDGRVRPVAAVEGRYRAAEAISADPGASLRQIARLAGVSLATARDVRIRLQRGEAPVTQHMQDQVPTSIPPSPSDTGPLSTVVNIDSSRLVLARDNSAGTALATAPPTNTLRRGAALLGRLRNDPALRFSNTGRILLRNLANSVREINECSDSASSIPAHCTAAIAELARINAEAWNKLANDIDRIGRQDAATSTARIAR